MKTNDEWYTPHHVFSALGETFDLDVAGTRSEYATVPARDFFYEGALEKEWRGFVWMNPPFGGRNALVPWLRKFLDHGSGIALTPDRTSAPWFQEWGWRSRIILFTPKIRFIRPDGSEGKSPANGTALWGAGARAEKALRRAHDKGFGFLVKPL